MRNSFCVLLLFVGLTFAADDKCNGLKPPANFDNDKVSKDLWFEVYTSSYEYNSGCISLYIEYTDKNYTALLTVLDKDSGKLRYWKSVLATTPTKGMYVGPDNKHAIIWKTDYENYYVFIMCAKDDDTDSPPKRIITFATRTEDGSINPIAKKAFEDTKIEMKALGMDPTVLRPVAYENCPKASVEAAAAVMKRMQPTTEPVDLPE